EIEDDQRRFFFAVLLHALCEVFVVLGELNFHVELARGLLNLGREEEVVNESKDSRIGIFAQNRQRFRVSRRERRGKSRTSSPTPVLAVVAIPRQGGAIAVIHGSGVNAVLIVARLARAGGTSSARIVGPPSAAPSTSASATGRPSWSCVHSPLKAAWPDLRSGAASQS